VRSIVGALLVGYLAARLGWLATRRVFGSPVLARVNYRGRSVATGAGVVVALAVLVVEGGRVTAGAFGVGDRPGLTTARAVVLLAALGFGVLGFIDDVAGSGAERGFRGHVGAAAAGRLTTGMVKLLGGGVVAVVVVAPVVGDAPGRLLADAALVALSANLGNLLDRAPGRTIKASVAAFAVLAGAADRTANLGGVAVAVGAGLGLLLDDLHERLMLGDAGSNVLGAVTGLGVVLACAPVVRDLALVAVAFLNVAGEVVSFSRVIEAVAPLRALDRAGRRP
jgi:UDP-N-acetylmuramyl pentapeptide phosphotransferase/UDP-N-acetylglucosamine-1-phosphate transferase